jgi:phospholipid transport system substrate-binding protein
MMYRRPSPTRLAVLVFSVLFLAAPMVWAGEPMDFIKKNEGDVTRLLAQKESEERARKFSKLADQLIDFRELASRALRGHWEDRSQEDRDQFMTLLKDLLEANYRKKLEGKQLGEDYKIDYTDERQQGDRAIVRSVVKWGDSEKEREPVEYKLMKKSSGWVIYDLVIDDISLEETYRESYTKIIEDEGWDALIQKMKDKIAELEE